MSIAAAVQERMILQIRRHRRPNDLPHVVDPICHGIRGISRYLPRSVDPIPNPRISSQRSEAAHFSVAVQENFADVCDVRPCRPRDLAADIHALGYAISVGIDRSPDP